MKYLFLSCATAILSITLADAACASASNLSILIPPDKSCVDIQPITLVVRGGKSTLDDLQVTVNGKKQDLPPRSPDSDTACYNGIGLSRGKNQISVTGLKEGKVVEERRITVYSKSNFSWGYMPPEYKRYFFHVTDNEKRCAPCHQTDFRKIAENPGKPEQSPCFSCHRKIMTGYKFVHGPAGVWSCTMCHAVDIKKDLKESVMKAGNESCSACHGEALVDWQAKKYLHSPVTAGTCALCHNVHASNEQYFLRVNAGDLCISCHEDILSKPHAITGFSRRGHPIRVSSDSSKLGRGITCASCHNPHAGDGPKFLKNYKGTLTGFCVTCHKF